MKISFCFMAAAAVFLVAGCETIPPGAKRGPNGTIAYDVPIEASAPGARIQVNGQSVGNTPVTIRIFGDPDGTFHDFGSPDYVIQAFPLQTNQFAQIQVFRTGHMFGPEDRIPDRLYFEMNQPSTVYAPQTYEYGPPVYSGPSVYFGPPAFWGPRFYFGPRYYRYHGRR